LVGASLAFQTVYGFMRVSFARGGGGGRGDCEYIATGGADWIEKLVLCSIEIANLGNGRLYRVTSCLYVRFQVMAISNEACGAR
jgi:hypothetical protein